MPRTVIRIVKIGLAMAAGFAVYGPALAENPPSFMQEQKDMPAPGQPDFTVLQTIPPEDVMWMATRKYRVASFGADEQWQREKAELQGKIEHLPRDRQQLVMLLFVLPSPEQSSLWDFFQTPRGDWAPQVLAALRELDLQPQADIFARAMGHFSSVYPADYRARSERYSAHWKMTKMAEFMKQRHETSSKNEAIPEDILSLMQPSEDDNELLALGDQFAAGSGYATKVRAFILSRPDLSAWLDETRAGLSDNDRLDWLLWNSKLPFRDSGPYAHGMEAWPLPYRQLLLLRCFHAEILEGGLRQYFYGFDGATARETVEALRAAGLGGMADRLQDAIALFPEPYPADFHQRLALFFRNVEPMEPTEEKAELDEKLDRISARIFEGPAETGRNGDALRAAMIAYAKRENILPR